jgi:ATP-binding cassette subfamily G (WHITE) protein 2
MHAQVCATIHSPSPTTYALFDRLMLLVGGRTVYFGPNREPVLEHFRASGLPGTEVPLLMGREAEWLVGLITGAGTARGEGVWGWAGEPLLWCIAAEIGAG